MFFLNLSLGEFLALLGGLSGIVTALYLLDRTKRKKVVSSLRFWVAAPRVDEQQRRKRIREPWSLILQLVSLLLLLLAIGQLEWGSRENAGRNHVIVLDTSSWMARSSGKGTILDAAKKRARDYARRLPASDRVMLIRAEGIATPVTAFSNDRKQLLRAIDASKASYAALNLKSALTLAYHALKWSNAQTGEIVFVGGTRVANWDDEDVSVPRLRVLNVTPEQSDDIGIRRVSVTRDASANDLWLASVAVRNYAKSAHTVRVALQFASTRFAPRTLTLDPGTEGEAEYKFTTTGAGTLTASINSRDDLPLDDRVQLELPSAARLRVAVYSNRASAWQPLLESDPHVQGLYLPPSQYSASPPADVMILDGITPSAAPLIPSLWIAPPRDHSPAPVATIQKNALLSHWNAETPLAAGLHAKELHLNETEIFQKVGGDTAVALTDQGPVVVARTASDGNARLVEIGFDPLYGPLKYEVSTPLLFGNILRWLEPEALRTTELTATGVGSASVLLDQGESAQKFRVVDERGFAVPFTVRNGMLQLYAEHPSIVKIIAPDRERVLSLTLPGIGTFHWKPASTVSRDLPAAGWFGSSAVDLWKWLAVLGGLGLLIEWLLFGKQRPIRWRPSSVLRRHAARDERELVER
ncbi:MAG TPA: BatA and WFA domain-containing protein [Bryobacteraceae bacterium]|nr:BatA and WFA domain-containing protein [Bryobacteraceae bacterium]